MENATYLTSAIGLGSESNRETAKSTKFHLPQAVVFPKDLQLIFESASFTILLKRFSSWKKNKF
jgi:hypothetical protein